MGINPFKQNSGERRKKPGNVCLVLQNGPYAFGSKYSIPGNLDRRKPLFPHKNISNKRTSRPENNRFKGRTGRIQRPTRSPPTIRAHQSRFT